ncbi:MAG: hypothetical protein QG650_1188, partial [Patescibacteria group bacterium]|nr:hypothetical protein [Patescibacteria group bacterium]
MGKTCVHELCPTCHGVFFDVRETEDEALAGISGEHRAEETKFCKTGSQQRASWDARPCPRCDETMMKEFEYSHESGIHIDLCPSCGGMFLDGGELEEIRRYLATAHLPKTETKMPEVTSAHKLDIELKG